MLLTKTYQWKDEGSFGVSEVADANVVGELIEKIREKHPDSSDFYAAIVAEAKKRTSILHDMFEWDDARAAHEFRLDRARLIVRMIVVVEDHDTVPIRAFVNVNNGNGKRVYTPEEIEADSKLRAIVLRGAIREAVSWSNKYHMYDELSVVRKVIEAVRIELEDTNGN